MLNTLLQFACAESTISNKRAITNSKKETDVDFSKLKGRAGKGVEDLQKKLDDLNRGGSQKEDGRFWNLTLDSTMCGSATIRFLPPPDGDDSIVKEVSFFFRGPGGVYSERSLTSIGEPDPVAELNAEEWPAAKEANDESKKKKLRERNQNLKFVSNILVVDDPVHPENNGKVFLFRFGKQVKNFIDKAVNPQYADDTPVDPFDMWFGCNFKYRSSGREMPDRRTGKNKVVPNYEDSKFADPSELFPGNDAKKEEVWKGTFSLTEFNDPKLFKSYDVLKAHLHKVLGMNGNVPASAGQKASDSTGEDSRLPIHNQNEPASTVDTAPDQSSPPAAGSVEEDDDMAFFASL